MRSLTLVGLGCVVSLLVLFGDADGSVSKDEDSPGVSQEMAIETIAETEKRIKKLVNSGFKMALPYLMTAATEIKLNRNCLHGLLMLLRGALDIKDWAIKSKINLLILPVY